MELVEIGDLRCDLDNLIFLIGDRNYSYLFSVDKRIEVVKLSIDVLEVVLKDLFFEKINRFAIVNTKFYLKNSPTGKKEIILANGVVLKVSRKKWRKFYISQNGIDTL